MSEIVVSVQVGDLIRLRNHKSKQLKTLEYKDSGILPIVDQGASLICGYTNDLSKRYDKGLPVIVFGDHTLHTKFIDFDFVVGADGTQIIIPFNENDDTRYLYYLILRAIELIGSEGYKRHLKNLKESFVPYISNPNEQQKIASILTSVDEVIEKTQSQIDKLQDLKKGTMNELLTRGIGHTEFKESPVGRIPKRWEVRKLKSLVVNHNSGVYKKKEEYGDGCNIVGVSDLYSCNIVDGQTFRRVPLTEEEIIKFSLKEGDLIYGESSLVREGIARTVCVSRNGIGTVFAWHTRRFSVNNDDISSVFLNYFLSSNMARGYLTGVATQTALTGITTEDYFGVNVIIPSMEEQQKIESILFSIDTHIEEKQRKLQQIQSLKKSVMQDLLTGKVRVSVN